ncbi:MAG: MotA/TolQ/ExbB proton channel family protein [Pseudomonas sp.]|uniref:MotA/TolQ/ExbB proton channel family protein n=1 Tax=Halopseudomonas laoshanensis TaxID=2268758 RepID=UPI001B68BF70|nr:MotA/TolQ/ExbB proton channel family protein [Pseudomonas sp.]MBQ0776725.1 MotA/TolQ/ExbB proton channel family protein [Pseudomonas sp.]
MDTRTLGFHSPRWQSRLRMLMLVLSIGVTGLTASAVLAQVEEPPATPISSPSQNTDLNAPVPAVAPMPVPERFGVREMFTQADVVVKAVMIFLVLCSLLTWAVLFEKLVVFAKARRANQRFLAGFRNNDLPLLHEQAEHSAMGRMWQVAQAEVTHFGRNRSADADQINRLLQRMSLTASIVQERDLARLGSMMGVLATIGATAPFIGLFGTVWGILNSFASIATMKSASLAIVAPGIAEALLATALGLFAAIPAVMIFNKFARDINGFVGGLDNFSAEMIADVSRKLDEVK